MAPLPPFAFIGVGLVVIVASLLIPNLSFFAVVGGLFVIYGFIRLILKNRAKPKEKRNSHPYHTSMPRRDEPPAPQQNPKKCWVCGARNAAAANFCGHCGHRLAQQ